MTMTKDLDHQPAWNTDLRLPLVTDDSELFEFQILLGGISLVLSRVHAVHAKNRFTYTRGLAMKLTRVLECGDPAQGRLTSAHLSQAMAECDRALDPGSLIIFKKFMLEALQREQAHAVRAEAEDFTYSAFLAEEQLANSFARQTPSHRLVSGASFGI
jgi:hypothetical protein